MDANTIPIVIAALLGSGGIIGGIVAWRKIKPEVDMASVETANRVVLMQQGVLEIIRAEMEHNRKECHEELAELREQCRLELQAAEEECKVLLHMRDTRIGLLETDVAALRAQAKDK